jgi:hypothetical protein
MESNHPSVGLPRPAGFEGRMGHQTRAAPRKSKARERSAVPDGADPDFDFDAGRIAGRAAATGRKPQRRARCVPVAAGQ